MASPLWSAETATCDPKDATVFIDDRSLRRLRSFLPLASRRIVYGRTSCIDGRQAHIVLEGVRARSRIVSDIDFARCGIIDGDLNRGVPGDDVVADEIPLDSGKEKDPIRISYHNVVHDYVVVRARSGETDAEVIAWGCVTISTQPVRTEPVAACAARQSYAAASGGGVPVSHRNVRLQLVVRRRLSHENSRHAISRYGHPRNQDSGTASVQHDSKRAKSLDDSGSPNHHAPEAIDQNPMFSRSLAASAPRDSVSLACNREPIQRQRDARRTERNAGCAGDGTGHVADELTIFRDYQRGGDGAADVHGGGRSSHKDKARAEHHGCDRCPQSSHVAPRSSSRLSSGRRDRYARASGWEKGHKHSRCFCSPSRELSRFWRCVGGEGRESNPPEALRPPDWF